MKKILSVLLLVLVSLNMWAKPKGDLKFPKKDVMDKIPSLTYNASAKGKELRSSDEGTVLYVEKDGKKANVSVNVVRPYYWEGQLTEANYEFVFIGVDEVQVKPGDEVTYQTVLGKISDSTTMTVRCSTLDTFLVRNSNTIPALYKEKYYFAPSWIQYGNTTFLDYRQVDSLEAHIQDYFDRWASELEEDISDVNRASIFNYPNLDSIRVKTKLNEYPKIILNRGSTGIIEMQYFGRQIFETETQLKKSNKLKGYTPVLYWQGGFERYLQQEYKLGDDIYLYCTFLGFDHDTKRIVINVRDFANHSDEEVVTVRLGNEATVIE